MRMTSDEYPEMIIARAQDELRELELQRRRRVERTAQRHAHWQSWKAVVRRLAR